MGRNSHECDSGARKSVPETSKSVPEAPKTIPETGKSVPEAPRSSCAEILVGFFEVEAPWRAPRGPREAFVLRLFENFLFLERFLEHLGVDWGHLGVILGVKM